MRAASFTWLLVAAAPFIAASPPGPDPERAGADAARFALRRARSLARLQARDVEFALPTGKLYDIAHNIRDANVEASKDDAATTRAMLSGLTSRASIADAIDIEDSPLATGVSADGAAREALCEGHLVAMDLHGGGMAALLGEEAAGTGLLVRSFDLDGVDGGASAAGDALEAPACLVPRAVCGEGHDAAVALEWAPPVQQLNDVYCEPGRAAGQGFLPVSALTPGDASRAGLSAGDCQGDCAGAERLVLPVAQRFAGVPRGRTVSLAITPTGGGTVEPLARGVLVRGLRRAIDAAYNSDGDTQTLRGLARREAE